MTIYVNSNVCLVEGLRANPFKPEKPELTPDKTSQWANAKVAYKRDGNLYNVLARGHISEQYIEQLIAECNNNMAKHPAE